MIMGRENKLNFGEVICDGKSITIRAVRTGDPDADEKREVEAVKKRCAEIRNMLASRSGLTSEDQERFEAEHSLLESFVNHRADHPDKRASIAPAWDSAADLLFDKGLQDALGVAGDLNRERFRFLVRFCATFPECKHDLSFDVARAYRNGPSRMLNEAAIERPLCEPETLRFLRAYFEGDEPLWKLSLSECARRMGWRTEEGKPDYKRVKDILRKYGIVHGMKGKPGRPKK